LYFQIDATQLVAESNENDNLWYIGRTIYLGAAPRGIDADDDAVTAMPATVASPVILSSSCLPNPAEMKGNRPAAVKFVIVAKDPLGGKLSYVFDFGDGTVQKGKAATRHLYSAAGTYTVLVTVTNEAGGTAMATFTVEVLAEK
jgi:hypothetical protein